MFVTIYALPTGSSPDDIILTRLVRLPFLPPMDFEFTSIVANYKAHGWVERSSIDDEDIA